MIAILDTIKAIKPEISTIAFGLVGSTATLLLVRYHPSYVPPFRRLFNQAPPGRDCLGAHCDVLHVAQAAGAKGKRFAMPNTRIMMHQPAGGAMGSADEVNITATELNRTLKVNWAACMLRVISHASPQHRCDWVHGLACYGFQTLPMQAARRCCGAWVSGAEVVLGLLQVVHRFYTDFTGQPLERIEEETDRDNFMSPKAAIELGLIDGII